MGALSINLSVLGKYSTDLMLTHSNGIMLISSVKMQSLSNIVHVCFSPLFDLFISIIKTCYIISGRLSIFIERLHSFIIKLLAIVLFKLNPSNAAVKLSVVEIDDMLLSFLLRSASRTVNIPVRLCFYLFFAHVCPVCSDTPRHSG